jgi:hypothetical protein
VRDGILLLAALGPGTLYALGIAFFMRFRLGEAEHAEIQRALRRRAGAGGSGDAAGAGTAAGGAGGRSGEGP